MLFVKADMYAGGKYFISVNAPKKSVLAGFPTQTHLEAGGAKLRLRIDLAICTYVTTCFFRTRILVIP